MLAQNVFMYMLIKTRVKFVIETDQINRLKLDMPEVIHKYYHFKPKPKLFVEAKKATTKYNNLYSSA